MKKRKTIIGLIATIGVIVAIFTLFATAFGGVDGYSSGRGNAYQVMFGNYQGYDAVPGMIIAWALLLAGTLFILVGTFFPGKIGGGILGLGALLAIAASVMFFFAPNMARAMIEASHPGGIQQEVPTLGVGLILSAVFGILGGLIALFAARSAFKD